MPTPWTAALSGLNLWQGFRYNDLRKLGRQRREMRDTNAVTSAWPGCSSKPPVSTPQLSTAWHLGVLCFDAGPHDQTSEASSTLMNSKLGPVKP